MAQNERKKKKASSGDSMRTILYVVLVVVGIAGAVALGTSGGSSDTTTDTVVTVPGGVQPAEYQKVSSTGGLLAPLPESGADTETGKSVAVLKGYDLQGRPVTIDPAGEGKATMVVFLAHWCPHCQREVPRLVDWAAAGEVPDNLNVMAVSTAVDESRGNYPPSEWLADEGWKYPIMADDSVGTAASSFGLSSFPYFVLLSPDNEVLARRSGEIEIEDLKALLTSAMGPVN